LLFGRRVTFALVIIASQLLLIALSITLLIELSIIMKAGSVNFIERNHIILITEIALAALISIFAMVVFALQIKRLGERRKTDSSTKPEMIEVDR
jgi:hypothetical protein